MEKPFVIYVLENPSQKRDVNGKAEWVKYRMSLGEIPLDQGVGEFEGVRNLNSRPRGSGA